MTAIVSVTAPSYLVKLACARDDDCSAMPVCTDFLNPSASAAILCAPGSSSRRDGLDSSIRSV